MLYHHRINNIDISSGTVIDVVLEHPRKVKYINLKLTNESNVDIYIYKYVAVLNMYLRLYKTQAGEVWSDINIENVMEGNEGDGVRITVGSDSGNYINGVISLGSSKS